MKEAGRIKQTRAQESSRRATAGFEMAIFQHRSNRTDPQQNESDLNCLTQSAATSEYASMVA
jgi:hypothetical protein